MDRTLLHHGEFLNLYREGHWEYVERTRASGAAIIAALTPAGKVLIVEQYRTPVHARTLELPAGIIGDEKDKAEEAHEEAARRELLEETGYLAQSIKAVNKGAACSGAVSEVLTIYVATGLRKTQPGSGVEGEDIRVHEIPLGEVEAWLDTQAERGMLIDPKLYAGLFFLLREERRP